ncbi:MAG TPA: sugar ABC transporter substrate-binding protein [Candidatus Deferrimicrobium sp.]|nr:sugar ABC transporter substrate-binding protein [Candidatus Deferrimicrobium sp.]
MDRPRVRRLWRVAALAATVSLVTGLVATPVMGQDPSSLEGKKVAFLLWSYDAYQQGQGNWFVKVATDRGAEARAIDGQVDPSMQVKVMSDLVAEGVDAIAFQPVEPAAAVNAISEAQAAGIPVYLIGAKPDPSSGAVAPSALFNDYEVTKVAGQNAATWLQANKPGEKAKLMIFDILEIAYCTDGRMQGFVDGVTEVMGEENVEILFRDTVEHKRDVAQAKMEDILQTDMADFNIFTSCGADGVLGGVAALQAAGRATAVDKNPVSEYIFTIDGTPSELELLFDPNSSVMETMTLTPKENGTAAADGLERLLSGDLEMTSDETLNLPGVLLSPDCAVTAGIFQEQYGLNQDFEPLDCAAFGQ